MSHLKATRRKTPSVTKKSEQKPELSKPAGPITTSGMALKPMFATHLLLLSNSDNAFVKSDAPGSIDDLFRALAILTRSASEAREMVSAGRLAAEALALADVCAPSELTALTEAVNQHLIKAFGADGAKGISESQSGVGRSALA